MLKNWTMPKNKQSNFNKIFVIIFWIVICWALINISVQLLILFLPPNKGIDVTLNQQLFCNFYYVKVGVVNVGYLNWIGITIGISVLMNCLLIIYSYWVYRNSRLSGLISKRTLYCLYISIVVFILLLFIINIFNQPLIDYKHLNIMENGWNIDVVKNNYTTNFNYVYNISFINTNGAPYFVDFQYSNYLSLWIILVLMFIVFIILIFIILLYNHKRELFKFKKEAIYV